MVNRTVSKDPEPTITIFICNTSLKYKIYQILMAADESMIEKYNLQIKALLRICSYFNRHSLITERDNKIGLNTCLYEVLYHYALCYISLTNFIYEQ